MDNELLNTKEAKTILALRKKKLAQKKVTRVDTYDDTLFVFKVEEKQKYAIPYKQMVRVIPAQTIVPVPGGPEQFLGVLYQNSEIWPVVSSFRLLKIEGDEQMGLFILCEYQGKRLAIPAFEIIGSIQYNQSTITEIATEDGGTTIVAGVYKAEITVLKIEAIFKLLFE